MNQPNVETNRKILQLTEKDYKERSENKKAISKWELK